MPLNSHSYLVAQGWQGTGKALREGAISRPVIIAQKKNLAGVGKDRDEAFPFWDQ
jgi:nucleolar protein TMA23